MNLLIIGYGKMGKAVEKEALERGHNIVSVIDQHNRKALLDLTTDEVDVGIEFTHPESFRGNLTTMLELGIPMVSGTTGWQDQTEDIRQLVDQHQGSFLYASNFSIGVNLLFELNRKLASLMNGHPSYDVFIEEQHHRFKADAPSGTAFSLGHQILSCLDRKSSIAGESLRNRAPSSEELSIGYVRSAGIAGKHTVTYQSDIDRISITHEAYNRRGFALGAVIAAEWLADKTGMYDFQDLFR